MDSHTQKIAISYIDHWLKRQIQLDQLTLGYSVSIRINGDDVYRKAFGLAREKTNKKTHETMTTDHLFRIASHTKTFTATAILQLFERGALALNEKITTYLPQFKTAKDVRVQDITLEHLLSHTAGLARDSEDSSFWRMTRPFLSREDITDAVLSQDLIFTPGADFKYSNIGFELLGWIIEATSGQIFEDYMTQNILTPLNLKNIGPNIDKTKSPYVTGYAQISPQGQKTALSSTIETGDMRGSTSFYGTPEALTAFYNDLLSSNPKLLSKETIDLLLTPRAQVKENLNYCAGFEKTTLSDHTLYGHGGAMPGNASLSLFCPETKTAISICANGHTARHLELHIGLWHILNFFQSNPQQQDHKNTVYNGVFYDFRRVRHFLPQEDKIYVSLLDAPLPFSDLSILEPTEHRHTFKITQENKYRNYGDLVTFNIADHGLKDINYGGALIQDEQAYEAYLNTLEHSFENGFIP